MRRRWSWPAARAWVGQAGCTRSNCSTARWRPTRAGPRPLPRLRLPAGAGRCARPGASRLLSQDLSRRRARLDGGRGGASGTQAARGGARRADPRRSRGAERRAAFAPWRRADGARPRRGGGGSLRRRAGARSLPLRGGAAMGPGVASVRRSRRRARGARARRRARPARGQRLVCARPHGAGSARLAGRGARLSRGACRRSRSRGSRRQSRRRLAGERRSRRRQGRLSSRAGATGGRLRPHRAGADDGAARRALARSRAPCVSR